MDRKTDTKALFLDLDGTLLNDAKEVTQGNREAIQTALAAGHKIIISTGRPVFSAVDQAERLGLNGPGCYIIAYNGGMLYSCGEKKPIYQHTLPLRTVYDVFDEAKRRNIHVQTYGETDVLVEPECDNETVRRYCAPANMTFRVIGDIRRDMPDEPVKVLLIDFSDHEKLKSMEQWLQTQMEGRLECFFSNPWYLEIVPVGMNKGAAVERACQLLQIPIENAVAAGDQENDISMVRTAGVGVAMCNGIAEIKAAADYITTRDNNHDGIAEVIEIFLL